MNRRVSLVLAALLVTTGPAIAQDAGGLSQQVQRGMQQAMQDLENKSAGITEEAMAEQVGEEDLRKFLEGAGVRLQLSPGGECAAFAWPGGDLLGFHLGKQEFAVEGVGDREEDWIKKKGTFSPPKRPQKLSLKMSARGQEISVECFNKYGKAETEVTYYVGPLNGLFCMGLAEGG